MPGKIVQTDGSVRSELQRVAYGLEEAAEAMGLGITTFSKFVTEGRCQSFRVGRRRLILKTHLQKFAEELFEESSRKVV